MSAAPANTLSDEILDFLVTTPTPEQIIAYEPPEKLNERLQFLLDQESHDRMTAEERSELDEFLWMEHFLHMLKIRARLKLAGKK